MTLPKSIKTSTEASKYLLETYPVKQICDMLAERLLKEKTPFTQISVTQEQMEAIQSLFKIKGIVGYDESGEVIVERRGRKRKDTSK